MKRVIFAVFATIAGLVGLLSFKSSTHAAVGSALPSAALPGATTNGASPTTNESNPTAALPTTDSPTTSAPATAPTTKTPAATSKTYDGSAVETRYGTVQVEITVSAGKITNVSFLQLTSHDGRSADINSQAGPVLLQETLTAQNSQIDTVSGATFTSNGYIESLQSALDQAGIQ